jgi:ABC-type sugar transport system ATPase subunit
MASVVFEGVTKVYPGGSVALSDFSLEVADGELVALVGPSGCGKSTVLRLLAGLETPTRGAIRIGGKDVSALPPQQRNVAMVFQDYALYPHLSVRDNLAFPLRMRGMPAAERAQRVARVAELLSLASLLERAPRQLSGGERQRVAMGRALVREPAAFLLDEPLSNLDAKLRVQVRAEIAELRRRAPTTMLYVTHDQVEALTLGDRVAVLERGRLQQVAKPAELYEQPANRFVAGFIGSPPMNFAPARWLGAEPGGEDLVAGVRPEAVTLAEPGVPGALAGTVVQLEALGHETLVYVSLALGDGETPVRWVVREHGMVRHRAGEPVTLRVEPGAVHLFARDGRALVPRDGRALVPRDGRALG